MLTTALYKYLHLILHPAVDTVYWYENKEETSNHFRLR